MKMENTAFVTKRGIRKPQLNSCTDNQGILETATMLSVGRLIPYFDAMIVYISAVVEPVNNTPPLEYLHISSIWSGLPDHELGVWRGSRVRECL